MGEDSLISSFAKLSRAFAFRLKLIYLCKTNRAMVSGKNGV